MAPRVTPQCAIQTTIAVLLVWLGGCCTAPQIRLCGNQSIDGIGAGQGLEVRDGAVWIYGDADTGVIAEFAFVDNLLSPTGRTIRLTVNEQDVIAHPTGLTCHPQFGTFIGNTVGGRGTIYCVDWDRMLADGNLDNAILNVVDDDLAVNGARPEFVRHNGRWLIATADYGPTGNAVRLYDPARLASARRTSDAGVLQHTIPCGPWVQNLSWLDDKRELVLVQNQIEGLRWRLSFIDTASPAGPAFTDFAPEDELEGFHAVDDHHCLFVTSSRRHNIWFGEMD